MFPALPPATTNFSPHEIYEVRTSTSEAGLFVFQSLQDIRNNNQRSDTLQSFETRFNLLASTWKANTLNISSISQMTVEPHYLQIIAMGKAAVPLILKKLENEPDFWFPALSSINGGINPVKNSNRGDLAAMTQDWINWAKENNLYVA